MNVIPIIERELRIGARRKSTYLQRNIMAGLAIMVCIGVIVAAEFNAIRPSSVGYVVFVTLAVGGYLQVMMAGTAGTVDSLSEEKRDGTLGLLFLSTLTSYDVIIGKLFVRSWSAFCGILAVCPVPAMVFLLGGVGPGQYVILLMVLLNTLFFSASIGMLASALCREASKGMWIATTLVLLPWILWPLAGGKLIRSTGMSSSLVATIADFISSPANSFLAAILPVISPASTPGTWASHLVTHGMAWFALVAAAWILKRQWQDSGLVERRLTLLQRLGWDVSNSTQRSHTDSGDDRIRESNPAIWLGERQPGQSVIFWGAALTLLLGWILFVTSLSQRRELPAVMLGLTALGMHLALKLEVSGRAGRALSEDHASGALELLLTTPLDADELVRGRLLALKRRFFKPFVGIIALDVMVLVVIASSFDPARILGPFVCFILAVLAQVFDLYGLAWAGLWGGINGSYRTSRARGHFAGTFFMNVAQFMAFVLVCVNPAVPAFAMIAAAFFYAFASFAICLESSFKAVSGLQDELRELATRAPGTPPNREGVGLILTGVLKKSS